jgi:hypothetical protein
MLPTDLLYIYCCPDLREPQVLFLWVNNLHWNLCEKNPIFVSVNYEHALTVLLHCPCMQGCRLQIVVWWSLYRPEYRFYNTEID